MSGNCDENLVEHALGHWLAGVPKKVTGNERGRVEESQRTEVMNLKEGEARASGDARERGSAWRGSVLLIALGIRNNEGKWQGLGKPADPALPTFSFEAGRFSPVHISCSAT